MGSAQQSYEQLVARIVAMLERGTMPWRKPWVVRAPSNLATRRAYNGTNRLLLEIEAGHRGYTSPFWLTEKQARSLGGSVAAREEPVVACSAFPYAGVRWRRGRFHWFEGTGGRSFELYNVEQTRGLARFLCEQRTLDLFPPVAAERIVAGWKDAPPIVKHEEQALYDHRADVIRMPERSTFASDGEWYATLFHEMVHATGHATRCNRHQTIGAARFGHFGYAFEELVAELGAAFLCSEAAIANHSLEHNAAYIDCWLEALHRDPRILRAATARASHACDWILGRTKARPIDGPRTSTSGAREVAGAALEQLVHPGFAPAGETR